MHTLLSSIHLFYKKEKDEIARVKKNFDRIDHEIETAYHRWEELEEAMNSGIKELRD